MSDVLLGAVPPANSERDAIHVAVVPMRASELLRPGQRVGVVGPQMAGPSTDVVGIVDPYLVDVVPKDGWFWLALLPNTVTGMRHHWQHSSFTDGFQDLHEKPQKAASVAWIKAQCEDLGISYDELMDPACEIVNGDYILNGLNESSRDHWYSIEDEFWKHYELVTGRSVPTRMRGGFTCSC
jgi:hypothetical protein